LPSSLQVDAAVDCVGFEARGCGHNSCKEAPAQVLNDCMEVVREGASIGIPGLGLGWSKSNTFTTGQCPVMKYNHSLMMAILYDKVNIADAVNAKIIR
jgi:glutathione-independent formaldehyde dehydrogenase